MPAAIDTRRTPIFDAPSALSKRPSGIPAATYVEAVFNAGLEEAASCLNRQTSGCHVTDTTEQQPVPCAVPASAIPDNDHPSEALTNIAMIAKSTDRIDIRRESGRLEVVAPCFMTLAHRTALARGRWMYEVSLQSDGLMQLGWCPPHDVVEWTPQLAVGDFVHSVAYDGHRRSLWKTAKRTADGVNGDKKNTAEPADATAPSAAAPDDAEKPPSAAAATATTAAKSHTTELVEVPSWVDGDVITACIDLERGVATYYANGRLTARTSVPTLPTMPADEDPAAAAYYLMTAAVTLGRGEIAAINYGDAPFQYPQEGFAGVSWTAPSTAPLPPVLRAHVASEVLVALASNAEMTLGERNVAAARVISRLTAQDLELLGCAVGHTLMRPVSRELSDEELDSWGAAVMNDTEFFARADSTLPLLNTVAPGARDVLRHVMVELGMAARPITFDVPSMRNINRRARAALRLAAHLVTEHKSTTRLLDAWPAPQGSQLERDLTPFSKPRYATEPVLSEIVPTIDTSEPLAAPELRFAAQDIGNDLFLHIHPFREHIFDPLVRERPWLVVNYVLRCAERQDSAATSGSVLFSLLASCLVRHAKTMSEEQFAETYVSRKALLSARAMRIESKRLGGNADTVRRRCRLPGPGVAESDKTVNVLLIATSWLFHATARRQIPSVMRVVGDLKKTTKALRENTDESKTASLQKRVLDLARRAVLTRGRMAHEEFVNTLTGFVNLIGNVVHRYAMDVVKFAAPKRPIDKNTKSPTKAPPEPAGEDLLVASLRLPYLVPCEELSNFLLLPCGFVTTSALAVQMLRRSMPFGLAAHLETHPAFVRGATLVALNPLLDQGELSEGLHFGSLSIEPTSNPTPHTNAIASALTPAHVAVLLARCLQHMQNDMSWSSSCHILSCISNGAALATERRAEPTSHGWLMWGNEPEPAELIVDPHDDVATITLARDAVAMLHSAQMMSEDGDTTSSDALAKDVRQARDFVKGFRALISRTSWLHSELGVSAQEELMERGNAQTRSRMSTIFDLLQRNLQTTAFFLEIAGDRLLTDAEQTADAQAGNAIVVQEVVELITLVLRDYGNASSLVYAITKAKPEECQAMHPWRIIAPALDALLLMLRPDDADAPEDSPARFAAWKRACQRMLTSPRIGWDVVHVEYAADQLKLADLIAGKKVSAPKRKLDWLNARDAWLGPLKALHERNLQASKSPTSAKKKKLAANPDLAAIGATLSTTSLDDFDDDTLCSICCVDPVNVAFHPCGHTSCRTCIDRQLAGQQKRCFFCNAEVTRLDVVNAAATPTSPAPAGAAPLQQGSPPRAGQVPLFPTMATPTAGSTSAFPDAGEDEEEPDSPGTARA